MTSAKRVFMILSSLILIGFSVFLFMYPDPGYLLIVFVLDVTLLLYGARLLIYYFTMARYMVGGIATLYKSIIVLDFGLFVFNMDSVPQKLIMLYLIGCMAFSGAVNILDSLTAKKIEAPWRHMFAVGVVKVVVSVACLFFLSSVKIMTAVYCFGLIQSAVSNIVTALRRTAIVYIE